ncbi:MAG: OmpA family protein [Catalinimonas sp.]
MRTLLTYLLLLMAAPAWAQVAPEVPRRLPPKVRTGEQYFEREEYYKAAEYFREAAEEAPRNAYAALRLGDAYRQYFEYPKAEAAYAQAKQEGGDYDLTATFWYALMLKLNGKYDASQAEFEDFLGRFRPTTEAERAWRDRAVLENNGVTLAISEMQKPTRTTRMEVLPGPVNTPDMEYAPAIWKHDSALVITAVRPDAKGKAIDDRTGQFYSDLLRYEQDSTGQWQPATPDDDFEKINTIRNDGAGVFSRDRTRFYYTSCWEGGGECYLYVSTLDEEGWSRPERLPEAVNYPGYDTKQPSLGAFDDTLYFVSDRPGGFGMSDIWYSVWDEAAGGWQKAVNLGKEVNTPFEDISPSYQTDEGALFFASNGHEGFGGLDIFVARNNFTEVFNAGLPYNSARDDFYLVLGQNIGYLTSNRDGNDNLYRFEKQPEVALIAEVEKDSIAQFESVTIAGRIVDEETNEPLDSVEVQLNRNEKPFKLTLTDADGLFQFKNLPADTTYRVVVREGKLADPRRQVIDTVDVQGSDQIATRILFENIYFDFDKSELRPEARQVLEDIVAYAEANPEVQIEMNANTDDIGSSDYNQKLSQRRGKAARDYLTDKGLRRSDLVIDARGESNPLVSNLTLTGRQLNRRVEFYVVGGPNYQAEAMAYITQPDDEMADLARRYGTTPEALAALNRVDAGKKLEPFQPFRVTRTGDYIIAPETVAKAKPPESEDGYYTVEQGMTLFTVSRIFGISVKRLQEINNLPGNEIIVGQRLRVRDEQVTN